MARCCVVAGLTQTISSLDLCCRLCLWSDGTDEVVRGVCGRVGVASGSGGFVWLQQTFLGDAAGDLLRVSLHRYSLVAAESSAFLETSYCWGWG